MQSSMEDQTPNGIAVTMRLKNFIYMHIYIYMYTRMYGVCALEGTNEFEKNLLYVE